MKEYGELDLWADHQRGIPNALVRSAVFPAIQSSRPTEEYVKVTVFSQEGFSLTYTGPELDQYDLSVWSQAVHIIKDRPLGGLYEFSPHVFLEQMGVTAEGSHNYEHLAFSLLRLTKAHLHLQRDKSLFAGTLLSVFKRDKVTGIFSLRLAPEIFDLFVVTGYTRLDWEERKKLRGKHLALALHGFYTSQPRAYPLTLDYLYKLTGSRTEKIKNYRPKVIEAIEQIKQVTNGRISLRIEGDKIYLEPAKIE